MYHDNDLWQYAEQNDIKGLISAIPLHPHLIDEPQSDELCETLMYRAASKGWTTVIKTLMQFGSKTIDTPDRYGTTPMHQAALYGHASIIELLVQLGSTAIDTVDNRNNSPSGKSLVHDHGNCFKTLKLLGASRPIGIHEYWFRRTIETLRKEVNEEEAAKLRHRVYFRRSLSARLLFEAKK